MKHAHAPVRQAPHLRVVASQPAQAARRSRRPSDKPRSTAGSGIASSAARGLAERDPAVALTERYWAAIGAWRAANGRKWRLLDKLPDLADVTRRPQVQVSRLLKHRDESGLQVEVPIYAHTEREVRESMRRDLNLALSLFGGLSSMCNPNDAKRRKRRFSRPVEKRRQMVLAQYREREQKLLRELNGDRIMLETAQRETGWRDVEREERKAKSRVINLRCRLYYIKPATTLGVLALLDFVARAERMEAHKRIANAPYGVSAGGAAIVARSIFDFMKRQGGQARPARVA